MLSSEKTYEDFTDAENENPSQRKSSFNYQDNIGLAPYSSEALRVLGAVEFGNYEEIESTVLDPLFIHANKNLVQSGELVHRALKRNLVEFVIKLQKSGYNIPDDLLLKSIKQEKLEVINTIISIKLYDPISAELELWYLLYKNLTHLAERLKHNEFYLAENFSILNHKSKILCSAAMKRALERKYDTLAAKILRICPEAIDLEMIEMAIENDSFEFIRRIWTGHINDLQKGSVRSKRNLKTVLWKQLNLNDDFGKKVLANKYLDIGYIVKRLLQKKKIAEVKKVIMWPEAADDHQILNAFIELNEEELARIVMKYRKKEIKKIDFETSFNKGFYWLCIEMLHSKVAKSALLNDEIQAKIVELLSDGKTCYFASEFLSAIDLKFWSLKLIPILNKTILTLIQKSESFIMCPYPLLFIVLTCEFIQKVAKTTLHYKNTCNFLLSNLLSLGIHIQSSIREESELKSFVFLADSRKRTVLTIIAENGFYSLLENSDLGSIISNMWAGERKTVGLLNASTLYKSFKAPSGSQSKLMFLSENTQEDFYSFQYEQLVSSCQLRFFSQMISTLLLVYFYTQMIYVATMNNSMGNVAANEESEGLLRISQVWIIAIFAEKIIQLVFCFLAKRKAIYDFWLLNDMVIFVMTLLIMTGVNKDYAGSGKALEFVGPTDLNIIMYGFVLCLIWLRFFKVMMTNDTYGPMLMIIFTMGREMMIFLIIFFTVIFIFSMFMTTIFSELTTTGKFNTFEKSLVTVFSASLGTFDLADYSKYLGFAATMEGFLVIILNILLLNILIAILGVTYTKERQIQTSKFRATLIENYNKWKWDEKYGILILLPPPLSVITVILLPFIVFSKNPERITNFFAKFIFIFYALPFFLIFFSSTLSFVAIIYFTSLVNFAKGGIKKVTVREIFYEKHRDENEEEEDAEDDDSVDMNSGNYRIFSYRRATVWIMIGWVLALIAFFRDCLHFWEIVFDKPKCNFTAQDVLVNTKFIQNCLVAIKKTPGFFIKFDDILQAFLEQDLCDLSPIVKSNTQKMIERKKLVSRFFKNFLYSRKFKTLKKEFLLAFITKNNHYDDEYFKRVQCIRVHSILKALKTYKKTCKVTSIKNIKIFKYLISGVTYQVKDILTNTKEVAARQKIVSGLMKDLL